MRSNPSTKNKKKKGKESYGLVKEAQHIFRAQYFIFGPISIFLGFSFPGLRPNITYGPGDDVGRIHKSFP